jgi:hypothetical protein
MDGAILHLALIQALQLPRRHSSTVAKCGSPQAAQVDIGVVPDVVEVTLPGVQLGMRHVASPLGGLRHAPLARPEAVQDGHHRGGPVYQACIEMHSAWCVDGWSY